MKNVIVRLRGDVARAWASGGQDERAAAVRTALTRMRAELRPQHPGVADPELQSWFTVSVANEEQAESIVSLLREMEAVEAAYVEPRAEPA